METAARRTILRIELWHGVLLLALLAVLGPARTVDPYALIIGGLFMALNFFLLSYGVGLVLTPLAGKRKVRTGLALLVLKLVAFLGLLTTLFFKLDIDPISFALGFSTLLLAIVIESLATTIRLRTLN